MSGSSSHQRQIASWYRGNSADLATIATESYSRAVAYFEKELAETESDKSWVRGQCSLQEVQKAVATAQGIYDKKRDKHAGIRKCIDSFASTLVNYSKVLDVITAVEPLYAGVAWGAIKFLMIGITQHSDLVSKLTTALARVGEALPRVEMSGILYNTAPMQQAIAKTYAHILRFLQRAISWYKASRFRRIYMGVLKPLDFDDIVSEIKGCIESVGLVAATAQAAEIRGQSDSLEVIGDQVLQIQGDTSQIPLLRADIMRVLQAVINNRDLLGSIKVDTSDSRSRICGIQLSQTIDSLRPQQPPERLMLECEALTKGRTPWTQQGRDTVAILQTLESWANSPSSASLTVRAAPLAAFRMRDMVVRVIQGLQGTGRALLWFMSYGLKDITGLKPIDVIRALIFQALQQDSSLSSREPRLCEQQTYQSAVTLDDWTALATAVLTALKPAYVVVEADALRALPGPTNWLRQCHDALEDIFDKASANGAIIKMLVVTNAPASHLFHPSHGSHTDIHLSAPVLPLPGRNAPGRARSGPMPGLLATSRTFRR